MYTKVPTTWQSPCGFSTEGYSNLAINNEKKFGNQLLSFKSDDGRLANGALATITWTVGRPANNIDGQVLNVAYPGGDPLSASISGSEKTLVNADHDKPLTLFAVRRNSDGSMWNFSNFRLYALTVRQNGQLKADCIPALNPSGVPGLYDTVTGRFLTNQGSSQFIYPKSNQWVRFTITKKNLAGSSQFPIEHEYNRIHVQLDELGLYSAEGLQQNVGLTIDSSNPVSQIAPGRYHYNGGTTSNPPDNLFDSTTAKWRCADSILDSLDEGDPSSYIVFTMHLRDDAAPVVKYNLRSGDDTYQIPGRAPVCWKVETSDNGTDWVVRDEQNNQATSGYTTSNNTWYNGGGSGNDPTTFYRLNPATPRQPSDYTRLDWIKSTRQQRIKTDYVPNARTWMEAELMLDGGFGHSPDYESRMFRSETGADGAMYSCHVASDQSEYHRFIIYRDATSGANVSMNINPIGNDATFLLRHAFRLENGLVTWGNEPYDFGTTAKDCANELYLFGSKDYNFKSYYMTVYSWKIYESDTGKKGGANETLVHDYVPALDSDGVPGLYDTVSHKF